MITKKKTVFPVEKGVQCHGGGTMSEMSQEGEGGLMEMEFSPSLDMIHDRISSLEEVIAALQEQVAALKKERTSPFSEDVKDLKSQVAHLSHQQIVIQIKTASKQNDTATIVALMNSHLSASQVQQLGCAALRNLAINVDNQLSIAKAGGIAAIVSGMEAHRDHDGVQQQGCMALRNLAANNDANQLSIAKAGGIVTIVSGMEAHRDHDLVQLQGCLALKILSFNAKVALLIEEAGGVKVLEAAYSKCHYAEHALCNIRKASMEEKE